MTDSDEDTPPVPVHAVHEHDPEVLDRLRLKLEPLLRRQDNTWQDALDAIEASGFFPDPDTGFCRDLTELLVDPSSLLEQMAGPSRGTAVRRYHATRIDGMVQTKGALETTDLDNLVNWKARSRKNAAAHKLSIPERENFGGVGVESRVGWTPLMVLCNRADATAEQIKIVAGACAAVDYTATMQYSNPLHILCERKDVRVAFLDALGDDVVRWLACKDRAGQTPWHKLGGNSRVQANMLECLAAQSTSALSVVDKNRQSALHCLVRNTAATCSNLAACVKVLGGGAGAMVSSERDRHGRTAGLDEGLLSFCLPHYRLYENPYERNT
jgi:hypothetical protein